MSRDYEKVFFRLIYSLKENKNNTIILGAGCSLSSSSSNDVSFKGLMEKCLHDHGFFEIDRSDWYSLYKEFINIVWEGKGKREREELLKKVFTDLNPSIGYQHLRALVENGYISTIITTNVDMLLDKCFEGLSYRKRVGGNHYIVIGEHPSFDLIKAHGDIENGELRFSPDELVKLPDNLQKDIAEKTRGTVIVVGYSGQDAGFMNSLNSSEGYAAYWADVSELDFTDSYTVKTVTNFMHNRNSECNYLCGSYGNFDNLLTQIYNFIFKPDYSRNIKYKEFIVGSEWLDTTIVSMLKLYDRIYELFLNILEISKKEQQKLCGKDCEDDTDVYYNEYLHSYLYFFDTQKLPDNLLHIPNNELDALILGVSLDIKTRCVYYKLDPRILIENIKKKFNSNAHFPAVDDYFWQAVERVVCYETADNDKISINMRNKLEVTSYDIPLNELNELTGVINFLSLFVPYQKKGISNNSSVQRLRQILCDKNDCITFNANKILINIGQISCEDAEELKRIYTKELTGICEPKTKCISNQEWTVLDSKWVEVELVLNMLSGLIEEDNNTLYKKCKDRARISSSNFRKLSNPFGIESDMYTDLQMNIDLEDFTASPYSAMFIVGTSGRGKTVALRNFICQSERSQDHIQCIILSPKNSVIDKYGLEMFLDMKMNSETIADALKNINSAFELRNEKLFMIFDGLNEISSIFADQENHYKKLLELAENIYAEKCTNIKLIVTCRESVYHKYVSSTNLRLNPLFFYNKHHSAENNGKDSDAAYKISKLSLSDKQKLLTHYGLALERVCYSNKARDIYDYILNSDVTPLFIAIVGETMQSPYGRNMIARGRDVYDIFSDLMIDRLKDVDFYAATKIIYSYFDLLIRYRKTDIEVTTFKLLDVLPLEFHKDFDDIILKMKDVNILANDNSGLNRIKFSHDQIEETFFKKYIIEFQENGVDFFDNIMELFKKNIIYRRGFLKYLISLINEKKLAKFKTLSLQLIALNFYDVSNIVVESLSYSETLDDDFRFLFDESDINMSRQMYRIIILGIENSLTTYPLHIFDLEKIIDSLLCFKSIIVLKSDIASLYYFKSKISYYQGAYEQSLAYMENANDFITENDPILQSNINIHKAIVFMEQGYSKISISLFKKEFEHYKEVDDFDKMVEVGIELGRAMNHSGQTTGTLALYDELLNDDRKIKDINVIAKLYERKANVIDHIIYHLLQFGTVPAEALDQKSLTTIKSLFEESVALYKTSMNLLCKINDMFTYTGVTPELINIYTCFSSAFQEDYSIECEKMIEETDQLFTRISTPFQADFYLAKAYFFEYKGDLDNAEKYIEMAIENSSELGIQNKIAKSNSRYAYFVIRCLQKYPTDLRRNKWLKEGKKRLSMAISYYWKYTITSNNISLEDDIALRNKLDQFTA